MKISGKITLLTIVGAGLTLLATSCASTNIKELTANDFISQAEESDDINSFHWTTYIGHTAKRVYLEHQNPAYIGEGLISTIYWTELSGLSAEIQKQIKAGKNPWPGNRHLHAQKAIIEHLPQSTERKVQ